MADLFWAYWDASVRFALLATALLLAMPLLKRWVSPRLLCWAWILIMARLSLPFALPFSGSIFNLSDALQPSTWTEALRAGVVDAGFGETFESAFRDQDDQVIAAFGGISWERVLLGVWLAGVAACLVALAANIRRLTVFFKRAERQWSGPLYELFRDTRRRFGINANVPLLVSDDLNTPGIAGIFNPRIVIPRACAEELSAEELRCIFLHELTHFRRGDLFLHHAMLLVCFLHWYNPLVWLVMRQYKNAMEQACDADVVDSDCIEAARQYGLTLLQVIQRSRMVGRCPIGALGLLGNRKSGALRDRIRLIARPRRRNPLLGALGLGFFGLSFVYALTGEHTKASEAERLVRLTRFSSPMLFISQVANEREEERARIVPSTPPAPADVFSAPNSWVQDAIVESFAGKRVLVRATYRMSVLGSKPEFWLSLRDRSGDVLAFSRAPAEIESIGARRYFEAVIDLPAEAYEMAYGLSAPGAAGVWMESVRFEAVD